MAPEESNTILLAEMAKHFQLDSRSIQYSTTGSVDRTLNDCPGIARADMTVDSSNTAAFVKPRILTELSPRLRPNSTEIDSKHFSFT